MAGTVGAGIQDGELFAAMAKHGAIAVGGTNSVRNFGFNLVPSTVFLFQV